MEGPAWSYWETNEGSLYIDANLHYGSLLHIPGPTTGPYANRGGNLDWRWATNDSIFDWRWATNDNISHHEDWRWVINGTGAGSIWHHIGHHILVTDPPHTSRAYKGRRSFKSGHNTEVTDPPPFYKWGRKEDVPSREEDPSRVVITLRWLTPPPFYKWGRKEDVPSRFCAPLDQNLDRRTQDKIVPWQLKSKKLAAGLTDNVCYFWVDKLLPIPNPSGIIRFERRWTRRGIYSRWAMESPFLIYGAIETGMVTNWRWDTILPPGRLTTAIWASPPCQRNWRILGWTHGWKKRSQCVRTWPTDN